MKTKLFFLTTCLFFATATLHAADATITVNASGEVSGKISSLNVNNTDKLIVVSATDAAVISLVDLNAIREKFKSKAAASFTIDLSAAKFANDAIPSGGSNGAGAFDLNTSRFSCLKEVILPSNLKAIGDRAFRYCDKLAKINLPDGLETIGQLAFAQNASNANTTLNLTELPNSVKTIGQYAFYTCNAIALTKLPSSLIGTIGDQAFANTAIAISEIPEGVTAINGGAFNCGAVDARIKITSITFPATLTSLNASAFSNQTKITAITFKTSTPPFAITAAPFSSITTKSAVTVIVPFGTRATYITYDAFSGMTIVEAPEEGGGDDEPEDGELHVTHSTTGQMAAEIDSALGGSAAMAFSTLKIKGTAVLNFDDCKAIATKFTTTALQILDLSAAKFLNDSTPSYPSSGDGAFNAMKMKTVILPPTLKVIGDRAFYNCDMLETVNFSLLLKKIGFAAFNGCSKLNITTLPASLETVGGYAFQTCSSLTLSTLPAGLKGEIAANTFYNTKVTINQIPYGIKSIGNNAFGNTKITTIIFPSNLSSIGEKAFGGVTGLTSITIKKDNPPTANIVSATHSFSGVTLGNITLHVPEGTVANFNFAPWNQMNIVADAEEEVILENPYIVNTVYQGKPRKYLLYRPKNFTGTADGVLVTCHGFGGKMENALPIYGFQAAADALNLIVISPQALPEEDTSLQSTASAIGFDLTAIWGQVLYAEVKAYIFININADFNKNVDDIGFIRELIQKNGAKYSANMNNVFIGGISMGGFMAYAYALRHGDELAGIINITGSMGLKVDTVNVTASLPILDFHSTTDGVVFYEGEGKYKGDASINMKNAIPKQKVLEYWARKNGISGSPVVTNLGTGRNSVTFKKIHYQEAGKPEILHYQLTGADHGYDLTSGDPVTQSAEIRSFMTRHMTERAITNLNEKVKKESNLHVTIADNALCVGGVKKQQTGCIYNSLGQPLQSVLLQPEEINIVSINQLSSGFYLMRLEDETIKFLKR